MNMGLDPQQPMSAGSWGFASFTTATIVGVHSAGLSAAGQLVASCGLQHKLEARRQTAVQSTAIFCRKAQMLQTVERGLICTRKRQAQCR